MKFELFGWELEIKKKEKRNIAPKEPKPRNEFDEVLKPFLDRMNAEPWKMEIGEHVLCFEEIEIWISNKFYAYGNFYLRDAITFEELETLFGKKMKRLVKTKMAERTLTIKQAVDKIRPSEDFKKEIFKLEKQITLPKRKVLDLERKRF